MGKTSLALLAPLLGIWSVGAQGCVTDRAVTELKETTDQQRTVVGVAISRADPVERGLIVEPTLTEETQTVKTIHERIVGYESVGFWGGHMSLTVWYFAEDNPFIAFFMLPATLPFDIIGGLFLPLQYALASDESPNEPPKVKSVEHSSDLLERGPGQGDRFVLRIEDQSYSTFRVEGDEVHFEIGGLAELLSDQTIDPFACSLGIGQEEADFELSREQIELIAFGQRKAMRVARLRRQRQLAERAEAEVFAEYARGAVGKRPDRVVALMHDLAEARPDSSCRKAVAIYEAFHGDPATAAGHALAVNDALTVIRVSRALRGDTPRQIENWREKALRVAKREAQATIERKRDAVRALEGLREKLRAQQERGQTRLEARTRTVTTQLEAARGDRELAGVMGDLLGDDQAAESYGELSGRREKEVQLRLARLASDDSRRSSRVGDQISAIEGELEAARVRVSKAREAVERPDAQWDEREGRIAREHLRVLVRERMREERR